MKLLKLATRAFRHVLNERSYERYHSQGSWDKQYSEGFDLSTAQEDGRYGALTTVVRRYEGNSPILDAGCGDGLFEEHYRRSSATRLVAIDFAQAAIDIAKARNIPDCDFFCEDYRNFAPAERFSVLLFNEALYYIENYQEILQRLEAYLVPGGVVIVSMFDTLITRRIWKSLLGSHRQLQGVSIIDEGSGRLWRIRVLQRKQAQS